MALPRDFGWFFCHLLLTEGGSEDVQGDPAVGLCFRGGVQGFWGALPAQPCVGFVSHCVNEHRRDSAGAAAWGAPAMEQPPNQGWTALGRGVQAARAGIVGPHKASLGPAQNQHRF